MRGIIAGPFCLMRVKADVAREGSVTRIGWAVMHETGSGGSVRFLSDHRHRPCAVSAARAIASAIGDDVEEPGR